MSGSGISRAIAIPLIWLVRIYQLLISPLLGPTCKFYPSCSAFAVTALQTRGPLVGLWLATRRLLRCHPWSHGGVDHVPPRPITTHSMSGELSSPQP